MIQEAGPHTKDRQRGSPGDRKAGKGSVMQTWGQPVLMAGSRRNSFQKVKLTGYLIFLSKDRLSLLKTHKNHRLKKPITVSGKTKGCARKGN